jgi:hypothetical protein
VGLEGSGFEWEGVLGRCRMQELAPRVGLGWGKPRHAPKGLPTSPSRPNPLPLPVHPPPPQVSLDYDDDGRSMSSETRAMVEAEVRALVQVRDRGAGTGLVGPRERGVRGRG